MVALLENDDLFTSKRSQSFINIDLGAQMAFKYLLKNLFFLQQFPLNIRSMAALQRADLSNRDEFGALEPVQNLFDI